MSASQKYFSTGIRELDTMLSDGREGTIRKGDVVLIRGEPGSGKTTLALQILNNYLINDDISRKAVLISLEEESSRLFKRVNAYGFELGTINSENLITFSTGQVLEILSVINPNRRKKISNIDIDKALENLSNCGWLGMLFCMASNTVARKIDKKLEKKWEKIKKSLELDLVIIDSLNAFLKLAGEHYNEKHEPRIFLTAVCRLLQKINPGKELTIIFTSEYHYEWFESKEVISESFLCDVEIALRPEPVRVPATYEPSIQSSLGYNLNALISDKTESIESRSFCRVLKSRSNAHQSRRCAYDIVEGEGIKFYPTYPGDGKLVLFSENAPQLEAWENFFEYDIPESYPALRPGIFDRINLQTVFEGQRRLRNVPLRTDMYLGSFDSYWVSWYRNYKFKLDIQTALEKIRIPSKKHDEDKMEADEIEKLKQAEKKQEILNGELINSLLHMLRKIPKNNEITWNEAAKYLSLSYYSELIKTRYGDNTISVYLKEMQKGNKKKAIRDSEHSIILELLKVLSKNTRESSFLKPFPAKRLKLFGEYRSDIIPELSKIQSKLLGTFGSKNDNLLPCIPYDANFGLYVCRRDYIDEGDMDEHDVKGLLRAIIEREREILSFAHIRLIAETLYDTYMPFIIPPLSKENFRHKIDRIYRNETIIEELKLKIRNICKELGDYADISGIENFVSYLVHEDVKKQYSYENKYIAKALKAFLSDSFTETIIGYMCSCIKEELSTKTKLMSLANSTKEIKNLSSITKNILDHLKFGYQEVSEFGHERHNRNKHSDRYKTLSILSFLKPSSDGRRDYRFRLNPKPAASFKKNIAKIQKGITIGKGDPFFSNLLHKHYYDEQGTKAFDKIQTELLSIFNDPITNDWLKKAFEQAAAPVQKPTIAEILEMACRILELRDKLDEFSDKDYKKLTENMINAATKRVSRKDLPKTWEEMIVISRMTNRNLQIEWQTLDSFICSFLEVFWSCGGSSMVIDEDYKIRFVSNFIGSEEPGRSAELASGFVQMLRAYHIMHELFWRKVTPKSSVSTHKIKAFQKGVAGSKEWVFARHWYSTFTELMTAKDSEGEFLYDDDPNMRLQLMQIPVSLSAWTDDLFQAELKQSDTHQKVKLKECANNYICCRNVDLHLDEPTKVTGNVSYIPSERECPDKYGIHECHGCPRPLSFSCWGEWSFGLVNGSENAELAIDLVNNMMGSIKVIQRAFAGASVPTVENFYEEYGELPCVTIPERITETLPKATYNNIRSTYFKHAKSRQEIYDFRHCGKLFYSKLERMRKADGRMQPDELVRFCSEVFTNIKKLHSAEILLQDEPRK